MNLSVVVPTKNRPIELRNFLSSLWKQELLPDQLIIIDQSQKSNVIKEEVKLKTNKLNIELVYIHDEKIDGLVQAKSAAIGYNKCSIISFFDDDIVLEDDCIKEMCAAFNSDLKLKAANGLILNYTKESFFKRFVFRITHIGIYSDNRREIIHKLINNKGKLQFPKKINTLSGGLTFYRKEIFEKAPFDEKNRFHAYEDKEHSVRIELNYPNSMYLIPKARLYHNHSFTNRESEHIKVKNDNIEIIKMYKKYRNESFFGIDLLFLLIGLFFYTLFKAFKYKKTKYISNYFKGIKDGFNFKIK